VPEPALRFLEYVFLALLYLFFLRVVRAVWVELREPRLVAAVTEVPGLAPTASGKPTATGTGTGTGKGRRAAPSKLVVIGPGGGSYGLADELTIGRAPGCAVPLPDDNFASTMHARVFRRDGDYWVEDLGSTNGSLVNGRRISAATPLRRGDRLQIGRTVLELQK
jgi:pSer/pThr/pTyr-binding forkhead associated (FHA) protein